MFITCEGIDGSGKTTQAKLLSDWLLQKFPDNDVLLTREPGGWENGAVLKQMVVSGMLKHAWSEAYLFMLDRCEHVASIIQPAIDKKTNIICERYHDSTLAYQVWGRGLPLEVLDTLASISNFPKPDVTLLFDLPPELSVERVSNRGIPDVFESEGVEFMKKVREGYLSLANRDKDRWIIIDASKNNVESVFQEVIDSLNKKGYFVSE